MSFNLSKVGLLGGLLITGLTGISSSFLAPPHSLKSNSKAIPQTKLESENVCYLLATDNDENNLLACHKRDNPEKLNFYYFEKGSNKLKKEVKQLSETRDISGRTVTLTLREKNEKITMKVTTNIGLDDLNNVRDLSQNCKFENSVSTLSEEKTITCGVVRSKTRVAKFNFLES